MHRSLRLKVCLKEITVALQKVSFSLYKLHGRADNSGSFTLTDMNFIIWYLNNSSIRSNNKSINRWKFDVICCG